MISTEELYNLYKKCTGVTTDSRTVKEGCMFFALKGDKFDGNDFAVKALHNGAKYAVVDRVSLEGESVKGHKCILVENVLVTLQKLAAFHRSQFDIPVVGITGTNGKTTTKELVAAVLSRKFNIVATQGNFNNHIGVPLTLFRITERTEMAVVEMGASHPGEIESLASIVQPTCGLITNVGKAHLLGFGSFDGIKKTKGELYDYLRQKGGLAFYNADNPHLCEMVRHRQGLRTMKYGVKYQDVKTISPTLDSPFLKMTVPGVSGEMTISTKLIGDYNTDNVLAALCVGTHFEVPATEGVLAIESYFPTNSRSQFVRTSYNMLIIDAYNANPTSMGAALENFGSIEFKDKMLILGDMLELGEDSLSEHKAVLAKAVKTAGTVLLVGKEFGKIHHSIPHGSTELKHFDNADLLKDYLRENPVSNRTILIKGSNGIRLQSIIDVL